MPSPTLRELPARNDVELTRDNLIYVLEYLSTLIPSHFSRPVRLVAHGGACMLLHPGLHKLAQHQAELTPNTPPRRTTRDVDYINRSFATEFLQLGIPDASQKLQVCIRQTAVALRLGADWMNSDADIALPMATGPNGKQYDPIYDASIKHNNVNLHTIFTSKNRMLTLVSVAPFWAVALKLVRYTKWDPGDICLLLKHGTVLSGTQWSSSMLETWLTTYCWTMGYAHYDAQRRAEMHKRINHAIHMVNMWCSQPGPDPDASVMASGSGSGGHSLKKRVSAETAMGAGGLDKAQAEWGGGDRSGWEATFVGNWTKPHSPPTKVHHQQHQLANTPLPPPLPPPATHGHLVSHSGIPPPPHISSPPFHDITNSQPSAHHHHNNQQSSASHLSPPPVANASARRSSTNKQLLLPPNLAEWPVERHRSRSRGRSQSRHPSPGGREVSREPEAYVPPMDSDYEHSPDHRHTYGYDASYERKMKQSLGGTNLKHAASPLPHKSRHHHSHSQVYASTPPVHPQPPPPPSLGPQAAPVPPTRPGLYHALSTEDFDRQLESMLYQSSRAVFHQPARHHHGAWRGFPGPAETKHKSHKHKEQPTKSRRKKEKKRDKARDMDRDSKWSSRFGSGLFGGAGAGGSGGSGVTAARGSDGLGRRRGRSGASDETSGSEGESDGEETTDCESGSESEFEIIETRPVIPGMPYQQQHQQQGLYASPLQQSAIYGQTKPTTTATGWFSPSHSTQPQTHSHSHSHHPQGAHRVSVHGGHASFAAHPATASFTSATSPAPAPTATGTAAAIAASIATGVAAVTNPPPQAQAGGHVGVVPQQFRHVVHPPPTAAHNNSGQHQGGMRGVVGPGMGEVSAASLHPHMNSLGLY